MTFEEVRAAYAPLVSRAVAGMVSQADAPDVEAEVWVSVFTALRNFDGRSSVKTWLYPIIKRRIADHYRKKYHDGRLKLALQMQEMTAAGEPTDEPPATVMPTAGELRVLRALAGGLDNAKIGRSLFLSTETVRSHVKSLYKKLKLKNRGELCIFAHRFLGGES